MLIFLSHIHEERELAVLIKGALEAEFAGFVEVFVSSDGQSIPAGANFLRRIEDGLVSCIGAVYLISPRSVGRSWISFELGAVWIRSAISLRAGGKEIPALPFCHSGMSPGSLPQPIGSLNAIQAASSAQLELAFRALQAAVGGKGQLRTDFDDLAQKVSAFEKGYTVGENLVATLQELVAPQDRRRFLDACRALPATERMNMDCGIVDQKVADRALALSKGSLKGILLVSTNGSGTAFGSAGAVTGPMLHVSVPVAKVLEYAAQLLR